ncbi:alpha/beta fold hydrolase [Pedococcus sp. 5OH_020]|uniref:alpha/beta fold hydrolase n=1 Tax=Pedococcus sp. 5OH_020 TaxID=2989814 RepID=UPI0022E9A585|nr:alpha/beta hydrolase [Pedococcus sp. 5OH_020]
MAKVTSTDITVDEVTYRVHSAGDPDGPAVLFLHGSGPGATGLSNWEAVVEEMGDRFFCLAPDMIGFGDSTHPENPPIGMRAFNLLQADTLWRLLDELDVWTVHLVGNSMGGMIAMRMALAQPGRVDTMLLMGSGGAPGLPVSPGLQHLRTFYADPSAARLRHLLETFVYDMDSLEGVVGRVVAERMPYVERDDVRRSHAAMFDAQAEPPFFTDDELAKLDHRTLCLHGRDDLIIPVQASTYLAEHLPNASLHVIPRCGHWTQIEQHDVFVHLLDSLIAGRI